MRNRLVLWQPFQREVPSLYREEMDKMFNRFFGNWERSLPGWSHADVWYPAIESYLEGDKLIVKADLPGMDPKDVEVSVVDNQLTLKGERKATHEHEGNGNQYFYRGVRYGRFERRLPLPEGVDADHVSARYHDGVLEITMQAPKKMANRHIPIEVK